MTGADHRMTYCNQRLASMLGYTVEELLGHPASDLFPGADQSFYESETAPLQAGEPAT